MNVQKNMQHYPLIRTIYLYSFSLLGLVLLIIAGVRFLDMGLKAFIFTKADEEQRIYSKMPSMPYPIDAIEKIQSQETGKEVLTQEEKTQLENIIRDYKTWQEQSKNLDPVTAQRHRDASFNLAMILIGLPLYLYHWRIIKRETNIGRKIS